MKHIITFFIVFLSFASIAQNNKNLTTTVQRTYYVMDLSVIRAKIETYLKEQKIDVLSLQATSSRLDIRFDVSRKKYETFIEKSKEWGLINQQEVHSEDYLGKVNEKESELAYLKKRKAEYEKLLNSLSKDHPEYLSMWREVRGLDEKIHRQRKHIEEEKSKHARFEIQIYIYQEKNPTEYSNFSLVNMPGVEYAYLGIENPKTDFSAEKYHGIFLKYMFTRGKTYGLIGAFKDFDKKDNENHIDELFVFALGQDFYSRYLGRGSKKTMNLYSSFNGGYILATSEDTKWNSWYMSAFIGLELLKTKYILLDNKIGYFIPFSDSRNMRGLSYRASFNFVF